MMEEDILPGDHRENIPAATIQRRRHPRREGLVFEPLEARHLVELPEAGEIKRAVDAIHLAVAVFGAIVQPFVVDDHAAECLVGP